MCWSIWQDIAYSKLSLLNQILGAPLSFKLFPFVHSQLSFTQSRKISRSVDLCRLDVKHWFPNGHLQRDAVNWVGCNLEALDNASEGISDKKKSKGKCSVFTSCRVLSVPTSFTTSLVSVTPLPRP